ncbi:MAG: hypothetical protein CL916_09900, partial [Deltaproteobacteria bacterium]|nr:hypothetical protein [Deltaproteobacteria bacterium]
MKSNFIILIIGLGACSSSEEGVKIINSDPTATITSHSSNAEFFEGDEITLVGLVSDANHSNAQLKVRWNTDVRTLCEEQEPDIDGTTSCRIDLEAGETQIKLQVQDPESAAAIAKIDISVIPTDSPNVTILSPVVDGTYYSDQLILFQALIEDSEDESSELMYQWESNIDGVLPITTPPDTDGSIEGYVNLSAGQHALSLRVEDSTGKITTESIAVTVGGANTPPLCSIESPVTGSAYVLGQSINFVGMATDEDINNSVLQASWSSNIDGVFDSTPPFTDGSLTVSTSSLSAGTHTITLRIEDEVNEICTSGVQIDIGTPPAITITTPIQSTIYDINDPILFSAEVTDQEDLESDIALSWYSDIDGEFSTQGSDSNGNISFSVSSLSAGTHNLLVTATDSTGLTASTSLVLQINTPPQAPNVTISPTTPYTTDGLVAIASSVADADGDAISYSYEWFQNSILTTHILSTIPDTETSAGEVWTVRVTPNDGYSDGPPTEVSTTIENTLPQISSVTINPSTVYNDTVLTCSATATDADQAITPNYEWIVGTNTYVGSSLDLTTTNTIPNDTITCTATAEDSTGATDSANASITIDNRSPSITSASLSSSPVYTNSILSCSATVSDDDGETASMSYTWSAGGQDIGTGDSIMLDSAMVSVSDTLTCTIIAQDGYGGQDTTTVSATIENTEPTIQNITLSPSSPSVSDTVVCSALASDIDGDTPSLQFVWDNLTTGISYTSTTTSATSVSLELASVTIAIDDILSCTINATDADGGITSTSTSTQIINTGPTFDTDASISPSTGVYTGTLLSCSSSASDPDDGTLSPTYEWFVGTSSLATGSTYTILANDTNVGETITCVATAHDSSGEVATSNASVIIENTAPVFTSTTILYTTAYNDDVLTCSGLFTDPDESLSVSYEWSTQSVIIGSTNTLDLSTTSVLPSETITCSVSVTDTQGATDNDSATLSILNRTPDTPTLFITPTNPT